MESGDVGTLLYMYLNTYLSNIEKLILHELIFKQENDEEKFIEKLNMSSFTYMDIKSKLQRKVKQALKSNSFKKFCVEKRAEFNGELPNIKLDTDEIDYKSLSDTFGNLTYYQFLNSYGDCLENVNPNVIKLIRRFYGQSRRNGYSLDYIEGLVNLVINNMYHKSNNISLKKLYSDYLETKEEYSPQQQLIIECLIFNKKPKSYLYKEYPDLKRPNVSNLYFNLEKNYYQINRLFNSEFDLDKYVLVREKMDEKDTFLLDMYFGYECEKKTISQIAEICNLDYIKTHDNIRISRIRAMNFYMNRSNKLDIDKSLYAKYATDKKFQMKDDTRKIFTMFIVEGKSYDEISKVTGLSNYKISNIVTEIIRKIDFYRFGLVENVTLDEEEFKEFLSTTSLTFTEEDQTVLRMRYFDCLDNDTIASNLKMTKVDVNRVISRFNKALLSFRIKDVELTDEDIIKAITAHFTERYFTENELKVLSYKIGVKNYYNKTGQKYNSVQTQKALDLSPGNFARYYHGGLDKVKANKAGYLRADLCYIPRDELIELFRKDRRVPISNKEFEIISYLFAINGYSYKSIDGLSTMYGETTSSVYRRYLRAILSIKKYLAGEIEAKVLYEEDIEPYLKYFSRGERTFIEEKYKNGLTYEQLSKKYKIKFDHIVDIFDHIQFNLYSLKNNAKSRKFDFVFYEENINNPKLPYYGNLELARKAFELFYAESEIKKLSLPEIIKRLDTDVSATVLYKMIMTLMISMCKLQDGLYKVENYSHDEILDYYNRHKDEMTNTHRRVYERYLNNKRRSKVSVASLVPNPITVDLLKEKKDDYYYLRDKSQEDIVEFLKEHGDDLPKEAKTQLLNAFYLDGRKYMSGRELNHIYRVFNKIDKMKKSKEEEKSLSLQYKN